MAGDAQKAKEELISQYSIDHAGEAMFWVGSDARLLYVNEAACRSLGYSREELLSMTVHDIDPIFPVDVWPYHWEDSKGRGSFTFESLHRAKDGRTFPVEITTNYLEFKGKEYHCAFVRDITERKAAEEKIKEQADLLNKTHDAILVQDFNDLILFCNTRTPNLYGLEVEPEELVGKKVNELLHKQDLPRVSEAKNATMEKGQWKGELLQITKDGKELIVESRYTLLRDCYNRPKSILIVNTDITEKKKLETQFLRAQRMESIGTLAGGIAHDLNNVLSPILMSAEMLKQRVSDEKGQGLLNIIENSVQRGANLVKQVLSFARGLEGEHKNVQIRYLISEIDKMIKETFPKSIEIKTDIPKDLWTISVDPTQFHQVLMNLCVNARDAMPHGGTLGIFAENLFIDENYAKVNIDAKVGPYIVITVSDTGTGISPKTMDRIFEPFFTTKKAGKGTGLGLSTAYGIVKSHGGFIHVYSEVGIGTRFRIHFSACEATETNKIRQNQIMNLPLGNQELILVVDDETSIREITKATLETYGYEVVTANNGGEAIDIYVEKGPDIKAVFLDMMMPIMDGPTTIKALHEIDPQVKIVAASGLLEKNLLEKIPNMYVKFFLSKPFTAESLLNTIHNVLLEIQ